ncbi:MAG TPA: SulP family inorganic anion transporter [Vicinamibacterales bacterium]|nr:SulP family inorganic anion transporter [Vicinamibacterales bacterium]
MAEPAGGSLRFDLIAGLTTAAVVIPKSLAYATIAGLPVEAGLYTGLVPLVVYAILGTSRPLSVTTTSTIAILVAGELALVAPGGDTAKLLAVTATLSLLVGAFLIAASVLRLGFLASFISAPVLTGFKAGIGIVIIVDQLPKLFGFHIHKVGLLRDMWSIVEHLPQTSMPTIVLAIVLLAIIVGLEHFAPHVPAPLVGVGIGIAAVAWLKLAVEQVGPIHAGLPTPIVPDVSLLRSLWLGAAGIALMSFVETAAAGRAFLAPGEPTPNANRELLAIGVGNAAGSLFQMMPAGGGTSQTNVNRAAGARTKLAGLVTAAVVVATLLFLSPVVSLLPQAALAAVVIATTLPLVSPADFIAIQVVRNRELWWAVAACVGVIFLGTLNGILVAVALSILVLFIESNRPPVYEVARKPGTTVFRARSSEHPEDETIPGLLMLRTEGRLHFANAHHVGDQVWKIVHEQKPRVVAFDMRAVPDIEYTALRELVEGEQRLGEAGTSLWLVALNPAALHAVNRTPLAARLGRERMFMSLSQAVEAFERSAP